MYRQAAFKHDDVDALHDFIDSCGLATVVTGGGPDALTASSIPLLLDRTQGRHGTLLGHVARANPHWRSPGEALVVFTGPDAYVSPSYYASKPANPKVVPTWNYVAVQARGEMVVHDDPAWVRELVTRLTDHHEAHRAEPWRVTDAPADYLDTMVRAIVGIEIPIRQLEGTWKLSQNRSSEDRASLQAQLADGDPTEQQIARLMSADTPR